MEHICHGWASRLSMKDITVSVTWWISFMKILQWLLPLDPWSLWDQLVSFGNFSSVNFYLKWKPVEIIFNMWKMMSNCLLFFAQPALFKQILNNIFRNNEISHEWSLFLTSIYYVGANNYHPPTKLREVMFSQVCLSVHGGSPCDHCPWCIGPYCTRPSPGAIFC